MLFSNIYVTIVSNFTNYTCFSIFIEEDGTAINNEHVKEFQVRKNAKIYSVF